MPIRFPLVSSNGPPERPCRGASATSHAQTASLTPGRLICFFDFTLSIRHVGASASAQPTANAGKADLACGAACAGSNATRLGGLSAVVRRTKARSFSGERATIVPEYVLASLG